MNIDSKKARELNSRNTIQHNMPSRRNGRNTASRIYEEAETRVRTSGERHAVPDDNALKAGRLRRPSGQNAPKRELFEHSQSPDAEKLLPSRQPSEMASPMIPWDTYDPLNPVQKPQHSEAEEVTLPEAHTESFFDAYAQEPAAEHPFGDVDPAPDADAAETTETGFSESETSETDSQAPEASESETSEPESAERKNQTENRTGSGRSSRNRKLLIGILIAVAVIAAAAAVWFLTPLGKQQRSDVNYMDQIRNQDITENQDPAVAAFFDTYYSAMSSGNTTVLEAMYDDPSIANITTEISAIVDRYDNINIYVTPGIQENDLVAFVYNDVHFSNVDAVAPSVDSFYLRYNEETGTLQICSAMNSDPEILQFMNLVSCREPIRSLLQNTNLELERICAENTDLNNLYVLMLSMAQAAEETTADPSSENGQQTDGTVTP